MDTKSLVWRLLRVAIAIGALPGECVAADAASSRRPPVRSRKTSPAQPQEPAPADERRTAFEIAARGTVKEMNELLAGGLGIGVVDAGEATLIHWAAWGGNLEVVKLLSASEAKIGAADAKKRTPLHWAAGEGRNSVVQWLIENKAPLNTADDRGQTPLHWAAAQAGATTVQVLLAAGADAMVADGKKRISLELAVTNAADNYGALSVLIKEADSLSLAADATRSLLQRMLRGQRVRRSRKTDSAEQRKETARTLVQRGSDLEARGVDGKPFLHWAATRSENSLVCWALERAPDLNVRDATGRTVLDWAVSGKRKDVLATLLGAKIDVNSQDAVGATAMHHAVRVAWEEGIRLLVAQKADLSLRDCRGLTPALSAANSSRWDALKILVDAGADVNAKDAWGLAVIDWAAAYGKATVVPHLLEKGAEAGLHTWATLGDLARVKAALEESTNVDAALAGSTALHHAAYKGHTDVVSALLAAGASVDLQDAWGATALHRASSTENDLTCLALLDAGAAVDVEDRDGRTALDVAIENRAFDIAEMLVAVLKERTGQPLPAVRPIRRPTPRPKQASSRTRRTTARRIPSPPPPSVPPPHPGQLLKGRPGEPVSQDEVSRRRQELRERLNRLRNMSARKRATTTRAPPPPPLPSK